MPAADDFVVGGGRRENDAALWSGSLPGGATDAERRAHIRTLLARFIS